MNVLLKFGHGLGDAVQFSVVLKHLQKYRPDWSIEVWGLRGKHSAWRGLCRRAYHEQELRPSATYDRTLELHWWENYNRYRDRPNSKITNCLKEVFGLDWDESLGRYQVAFSEEDKAVTGSYLTSIGCGRQAGGRFNAAVIHYQGNTSVEKKNLQHPDIQLLCERLINLGLVPIILDWDRRSPLPDDRRIFCPRVAVGDIWGGFGSGDAARITALIAQASLFVGIDSGPGKCASATDTPAIIVWTGHHPLQFHDPAPNTLHLVTEEHATMPPLNGDGQLLALFQRLYRFKTYSRSALATFLLETVDGVLAPAALESPWIQVHGFQVRRDNFDQDMVIVNDIYVNDAYKTTFFRNSGEEELVIDVGAHIGCFARLWHEKNPKAKIICVEACPENIPLLQANVGHFAMVVHAACTYEPGEMALLNAVRPNCESTGGSTVVPANRLNDEALRQPDYEYWHDRRPLRKVTLEDLMAMAGRDRIEILKLDCEGSEFSILAETPSRARIRTMLGEYHGLARWDALRGRYFQGWDYGHMFAHESGLGIFHLVNPVWPPAA